MEEFYEGRQRETCPSGRKEEEEEESARVPRQPYKDRPDLGMLGIASGSYNGRGSRDVEADLKSAPARILLLQHVSDRTLETLRRDNVTLLPIGGGVQPRDAAVDIRRWEHFQIQRDGPGSGLQGGRCAPRVEARLATIRFTR